MQQAFSVIQEPTTAGQQGFMTAFPIFLANTKLAGVIAGCTGVYRVRVVAENRVDDSDPRYDMEFEGADSQQVMAEVLVLPGELLEEVWETVRVALRAAAAEMGIQHDENREVLLNILERRKRAAQNQQVVVPANINAAANIVGGSKGGGRRARSLT